MEEKEQPQEVVKTARIQRVVAATNKMSSAVKEISAELSTDMSNLEEVAMKHDNGFGTLMLEWSAAMGEALLLTTEDELTEAVHNTCGPLLPTPDESKRCGAVVAWLQNQ